MLSTQNRALRAEWQQIAAHCRCRCKFHVDFPKHNQWLSDSAIEQHRVLAGLYQERAERAISRARTC